MRKFFILLLGAMMALTFAACGGSKDDKPSSPVNSGSDNDTIIELPEDPF